MTSEEIAEQLRREADFAENNQFDKGAALFRQAADTLQSQERRIGELEAKLNAQAAAGEAALEYFNATTCPCTAAERYVPSCPKHGTPEPARATLTTGGGHDGQG